MTLSWDQIVRLGLVQMALGAIVVLTASTLNRLTVVELALSAVLPGLLVALKYGIQVTRPNRVSQRSGRTAHVLDRRRHGRARRERPRRRGRHRCCAAG